ncbi:YjfA family protein, partial [Streptomyces sp. T-3]|nr:YjfA family protein [Streptomyces sp. T-3]
GPRTEAPAGMKPPGPPFDLGGSPPPEPGGSPDRQRRRRKLTMFLAGVVGALVVIAAAIFLTDLGKGDKDPESKNPTAGPTTPHPDLPDGVKCVGKSCTGKDPENMGCGGEFAKTTTSVLVGPAKVEVRYSKTCGAAWARITSASPGDTVQITGAGSAAKQNGEVDEDFDAYTPMVAVKSAEDAKACATLKAGQNGCTK